VKLIGWGGKITGGSGIGRRLRFGQRRRESSDLAEERRSLGDVWEKTLIVACLSAERRSDEEGPGGSCDHSHCEIRLHSCEPRSANIMKHVRSGTLPNAQDHIRMELLICAL
jgi:hypothetical protein